MEIKTKLAEELVTALKKKGIMIATAESMTGGYLAKVITDIPGTSEVFDRGVVTYSNESKMSELDVSPSTIEGLGAISEQTAFEMVEGLRIFSGCALCIAITGNAGPHPSEGKELGMYYVACYYEGNTRVYKFKSEYKTREDIRTDAVNVMLETLLDTIK